MPTVIVQGWSVARLVGGIFTKKVKVPVEPGSLFRMARWFMLAFLLLHPLLLLPLLLPLGIKFWLLESISTKEKLAMQTA